jgi:trimeric autotransporter adhesin
MSSLFKKLLIGSASVAFVVTILPYLANAAVCAGVYTGGTGICYPNVPKAHTVLLGNGSGGFSTTSPSTAGYVLTSNGVSADPTFQAATGGISYALATTSPWTGSGIAYRVDDGHVSTVATSTLTAGSGLSGSFTQIGSGGSLSLDNTGNWAGTWQTHSPSYFQVAGTYVTSVGATYPIVSSGGTTPTISTAFSTSTATINSPLSGTLTTMESGDSLSISQANTSTNGYLSSTDWNTFNGKQSALGSLTGIIMGNAGSFYGTATSSPIAMSISGNASTVTTNANLSGVVTSSGNTTSFGTQNAGVLGAVVNGATTAPLATTTLYGALGTAGYVLMSNGTSAVWAATSSPAQVYPGAGIAVSTGSAWGTSLTDNSTNWNTAYTDRITSATYPLAISSNVISTNFGTTTSWGMGNNGLVMTGGTGIPFSQATSSPIALNISGNAGTVTNGVYTTGAGTVYQQPITLTTTGTSGAATFTSNTLNIPQYSGTSYWSTGSNNIWNTNSLNVGIGTTTPSALLTLMASSTLPTENLLTLADSTGAPIFTVATSSTTLFGVGTSTPYKMAAFGGDVVIGASTAGGTNGNLYLAGISSGNMLKTTTGGQVTNATNGTDYTLVTAVSCTNQVMTALTAAGSGTCSSVSNTMLSNSTISGISLGSNLNALTATDGTLTFSGSYNGSTARTVGLNLGNSNTWTALQTFGNASTTQATFGSSNKLYINSTGEVTAYDTTNGWSGQITPTRSLMLQTGTTTAWTASTTGAYMNTVVMPFAGTIHTAKCTTDAGTLNVDIYHTTTHLTLFNASTTVGTVTFSTNNTVTAGEKLYMVAGTPASTPTSLTCTLAVTENI